VRGIRTFRVDNMLLPMVNSHLVLIGKKIQVYTHLRYEGYQFLIMLGLFIGIYFEDLANTVIMVPLLKELFFIRNRVSLDEILELREIGSKENTTTHYALSSFRPGGRSLQH
jgi:hypothetical protein